MSPTELKIKKAKLKTEKGLSLLFVILILSVILSIALGISLISLQQTKMLREVGYSVTAFYAADTGIERVLLADPPTPISGTLPNDASYAVEVELGGAGDCDIQWKFCIKSTGIYPTAIGIYPKTNRAIEINY